MAKKKILAYATGYGESTVDAYFTGALKGFESIEADIYLFMSYATVFDQPGFLQGELNINNLPNPKDFDGALLVGNSMDIEGLYEKLNEKCVSAGIPIVTTGRRGKNAYYVGLDNATGMNNLCEHLITRHGVKRIIYIAGSPDSPDSELRLKNLRRTMEKHNLSLPKENVFYSNWSPEIAAYYVTSLHDDGKELPDAFVCANDILAMSVSSKIEELGYSIPKDTIVTGFDNISFGSIFSPSLSTVEPNFEGIGEESAKILIKLMEGEKMTGEKLVPSHFIPSESCGCNYVQDLEKIRKNTGKGAFIKHMEDSLFERKLTTIERSLSEADSFDYFGGSIRWLYDHDHEYEGDSFHIVLDQSFKRSISDPNLPLRSDGYDDTMDVVLSVEHGKVSFCDDFETRKLVPQIDNDGKNRLFMFMPLHENENTIGYVIFCDDPHKLSHANRLFTYMNRLDLIISKFRQNQILKQYVQTLKKINETDSLTSVKNRTAFEAKEAEIDNLIANGECDAFSVAVFDVNNLKAVNDFLGHAEGDEYLVNCCKMICNYFKKSPVYRIGGDEFLSILTGEDNDCRELILSEMQAYMERLKQEGIPIEKKLSVAVGVSSFDPASDRSFDEVMVRADTLMYQNKIMMKGVRNIR